MALNDQYQKKKKKQNHYECFGFHLHYSIVIEYVQWSPLEIYKIYIPKHKQWLLLAWLCLLLDNNEAKLLYPWFWLLIFEKNTNHT